MIRHFSWTFAALLMLVVSAKVNSQTDVERLIYQERPLLLSLRTGYEHRVEFPEAVTIQIPSGAIHELHSLQASGQMVYWRPSVDMDKQRILAFSLDQQRIYLVDIESIPSGKRTDYRIDNPVLRRPQEKSLAPGEVQPGRGNPAPAYARETKVENPPGVILTRFASQSLFAPTRLVPKDSRIHRVQLAAHPEKIALIRSSKGEHFRVETHAAWRGFGFYVTAVALINTSDITVELDMRNVRGNFQHLTPQHTWVGPAGTSNDRTVLYLVSRKPYHVALQEVSYGL